MREQRFIVASLILSIIQKTCSQLQTTPDLLYNENSIIIHNQDVRRSQPRLLENKIKATSLSANRGLQLNCFQGSSSQFDCLTDKVINSFNDRNRREVEIQTASQTERSKRQRIKQTIDNKFEGFDIAEKNSQITLHLTDHSKKGRIQPHGHLRGSNEKMEEIEEIKNVPAISPMETPMPSSFTNVSTDATRCGFSLPVHSNCFNILTPDMESADKRFYFGEYMCSPNMQYFFGMTLDGFLSICSGEKEIWSVGPFMDPNSYSNFQRDGNLVVYSGKGSAINGIKTLWSSKTNGFPMATLEILNDGTLQIISITREIVWEVDPLNDLSVFLTPSPSQAPQETPHSVEELIISQSKMSSLNGLITFHPGELVFDSKSGLFLSKGLKGRIIATTGEKVKLANGDQSLIDFHNRPDAGGCFSASDGGWYYLSNSEGGSSKDRIGGGVGRIHFDANGGVKEYKMVLEGTKENCGSGVTPWGTYISCEERDQGQCWEVHPEEHWDPRMTKMGGEEGGKFESAAFDDRNWHELKAFVTMDRSKGALRRFSPNSIVLERAIREGDFFDVLHQDGTIDYLELFPESKTFQWTESRELGELSAKNYFPNAEGIDVHDGVLYFVSKANKELFTLNLDTHEYSSSSTESGPFNGQPDQIVRLLSEDNPNEEGLLYFLEDGGGSPAGVYARDSHSDQYYTIVQGGRENSDETTGLAFCDDGKRMMFAFQDEGKLYEIVREDGKPFYGGTVNIKYHSNH